MDKPFDESWFHAPLRKPGETARMQEEEAFHLRRVLRVRPGRRIIVTNGSGRVFLCDAMDVEGGIEVTAAEVLADEPEPPRLHMVLSLLKGRDAEAPVEGLCQLPVAAIHLVLTDHSQDFKGQDHARLMERLRSKSLVALKQARKPWLTEIHPPLPLRVWRTTHPGPLLLVHPGPDKLPQRVQTCLYVLTGPEGGFSHAEAAWLTAQMDCGTLSLGNTRIRGTHAPFLAAGKLMGLGYL